MNIGDVVAQFKADLTGFKDGLKDAKKSVSDVKDAFVDMGEYVGKASKTAAIATGVMVAGVIAFGKSSVDAFSEAQVANSAVNASLKSTAEDMSTLTYWVGESTTSYKGQIKALENQRSILKLQEGDHKTEIENVQKQINSLKLLQLTTGDVTNAKGKLVTEVNKNAMSFKDLQIEAEKLGEKYIKLGFDDEETMLAFSKSISVTKDLKQTQTDLALATDFARLKNIGLREATDVLQLAYMGNARVLKSYGINVKDLADKQEIQTVISEKARGQAEAYANTYAGKLERLQVEFTNIQETVGEFIVNALTPLVDMFNKVADSEAVYQFIYRMVGVFQSLYDLLANGKFDVALTNILGIKPDDKIVTFLLQVRDTFMTLGKWISENQETVLKFLTGLAIAFGALAIIGTIAGMVALLTNPLVVITAVIALLYTAWTTNFMGIQTTTETVINYILAFFNAYLLPFILMLVEFFRAHWTEIQLVFTVVWNLIRDLITVVAAIIFVTLFNWIVGIYNFIKEHWDNIVLSITSAWNIIKGVFEVAIGILGALFAFFVALLTGNWEKGWKDIHDALNLAWNGIKSIFSGIIGFITGWGKSLYDNLIKPFADAWNEISKLVQKIKDALDFTKRHSPSVIDIVKSGVTKVNSILGDLGGGGVVPISHTFDQGGIIGGGGNTIAISLAGANISSPEIASEYATLIGDQIVRTLSRQVKQ